MSEKLNVIVVCDGEESSGTFVMKDVARFSCHNLTICHWTPERHVKSDTDIVYLHYGGLLHPADWSPHGPKLIKMVMDKNDHKWIAGLRGATNLKRWTKEMRFQDWMPETFCEFVYELDAISVANKTFEKICIDAGAENIHVCHSGVDSRRFVPQPLPEHFNIGWAGLASTGAKDVVSFLKLPFPKRTAAVGFGTYIPFDQMHTFYPRVSVYVSTSVEEGSAVPPKEAAACGRPVVAIETGDFAEWLPEQWMVENTPGAWKNLIPLIEKLRDDRRLLELESKRFRKLGETWDYSIVAHEYDKMFESVM